MMEAMDMIWKMEKNKIKQNTKPNTSPSIASFFISYTPYDVLMWASRLSNTFYILAGTRHYIVLK